MKRILDFLAAILLSIVLFAPLFVLALIIKLTSSGPVFYWSDRVGKNNKLFKMCKFRTMRIDTPPIATHLMQDADRYLTVVGSFYRKYSLDELPQLFNIIKGDMSFVGPRPALFNQSDLIELRTKRNVHTIIPGVTGWAQVNGRDVLPIPIKVDYDEYYLKKRNFILDLRIIFMTVLKVIKKEGVSH